MNKLLSGEKPASYNIGTGLLFILIVLIGIVIRLVNYIHNPGLWLDEAVLALNLIEKSYSQLLLPLDNFQVAPVLFLWVEKLNVNLFGSGELALRLFPLICSVASLPLIYSLAKNLLHDEKTALTALFIFAITPIQVRYSTEVKQYMTDVFVLLFLFWLFSIFLKQNNKKILVLFAVAGVISIFLSHISVLVLFTVGIYWLISGILSKKRGHAEYAVISCWLLAFGVYYYFFINAHQHEQYMLYYWRNNFMPLNIFSREFWHFLIAAGNKIFYEFMIYNQAGLTNKLNLAVIGLFLIIYGLGLLILIGRRKMTVIYFVTFPILLHLLLSGFKQYPLDVRLALYLAPLVIMTFSHGLIQSYHASEKILRTKWPGIVMMMIILSVYPYKLCCNFPIEVDGARESIKFINERFHENQRVYVYYFSNATFLYYEKTGKVRFSGAVIAGAGEGDVVNWQADLNNLKELKGEVWLLFSHLFRETNRNHPEKNILNALLEKGLLVNSFQTKNSSVYLVLLK